MRPVQDRFVAATHGTAPPLPLLFRNASRAVAWVLIAASALLIAVATVVLVTGWGDVSSPLALHRRVMLGVDVLFFSAAAYCFIHATVVLRALEALPYRAGTYVFPACIIDASGPILRVWSVADADAIERLPGPALALRMRDGERVPIPARGAAEVDRVEAALSSHRSELKRAIAEDDVDTLADLDPLHHTRISSPISSTEGMRPPSPMWARLDWVLALAIGAALGLGLGSMRNASSDERMYKTVVAAASIPLYEQYLSRGGSHSAEVRDVYLARAELLEAERSGTLEALQAYGRTHPDTGIGPEIDAAMRRAMTVELDKARRVGTVGALDEFARTFPESHLDAELKAARHALYAQALAAWKKKAQVDPATSAFIERLLASAEKVGSGCEVRFQLEPSKTVDEADKRVMKHPYYPGPDALPSHYVTVEAMRPREQRVAQAVADGFAGAFSPDILAVRPGPPLAADAQAPAGVPTLVLRYAVEWTSAMTASAKPRTVFVGIRADFDGRFALPEGAPLQVSLKSWRGAELWKIKGGSLTLGEFHGRVYDAMIDGAFAEWQKKLLDTFF
jgi:hypothetical protein